MPLLVLVLVVVPLAELAVIIQVGDWLGVVDTIGLLILISVVGVWLVKHQGLGVLRRISEERSQGRVPGAALADGALIIVAGVLLLTPGFLTDLLGLALLVPPVRHGVRTLLRRRWGRRLSVRRYDLDV